MMSATRISGRGRRGQTIIVAMAILFLLVVLGGVFITLLIRNMQRVTRQGATDDALTLSLAGLQFAAQQFSTNERGADWRPQATDPLWRDPNPPVLSVPLNPSDETGRYDLDRNGVLDGAELRRLDPDFEWLDPVKTGQRPFVRIPTGRGRFLLRVTYNPRFRPASAASETSGRNDHFDKNSGMVHIEVIGRPGEFDPSDPTSFARDATEAEGARRGLGLFRKVEAFVPIGLVDQLWWVTNYTNERRPARLGIPGFANANYDPNPALANDPRNRQFVEYPSLFEGGIRSDVDLQWYGRNVVRLYPSRGDSIAIKGKMEYAPRSNQVADAPPELVVQGVDDNTRSPGDTPDGRPILPGEDHLDDPNDPDDPADDQIVIAWTPRESEDQNFNPDVDMGKVYTTGRTEEYLLQDEAHRRNDLLIGARSIRGRTAPSLAQIDPTTGISRLLLLTRDSGATINVSDRVADPETGELQDVTRQVNTGWYGLTDNSRGPRTLDEDAEPVPAVPAALRAKGLYLDNFGDIQYPNDRRAVRDEWLRRGSADVRNRGWLGDLYVPSVVEQGVNHPVAELWLTSAPLLNENGDPVRDGQGNAVMKPVIVVTRFDLDPRQLNVHPATGRLRQFHNLTVTDANPTTRSGTLQPVGTSRVFDYPENGVVFAEGSIRIRGIVGTATAPAQLTIVSGGTIYIEGNVLKAQKSCFLGLLAQDFLTVNPTAFTRVRPGDDVVVEANTFGPNGEPTSYHFNIPQGGDFDISTTAGVDGLQNALLHVKHSAIQEDATSETAVSLILPGNSLYDFGINTPNTLNPPPPNEPAYTGTSQLFYLFHQIYAGAPNNWAESNRQSVAGGPASFERKTFFIPNVGLPPNEDLRLRLVVGPKTVTPQSGSPETSMSPNGQPYLLSRVALLPADGPLQIRIEAIMYAFTGSWYVIPPPFFNNDSEDTRAEFRRRNDANPETATRPDGVFPRTTDHYPFFNEALNIDLRVSGAISENMPADPVEATSWINRMWVYTPDYDPTVFPPATGTGLPAFRPNLRYRYDYDLKRMVRVRFTRPYAANGFRTEEVAWVAPGAPPVTVPPMRDLSTVLGEALTNNSYAQTLPVLPNLPSGSVIYEGNPL